MPHMMMEHDEDPAKKLLETIGDISGVEIFHNHILLATYIRPEKTKGGLHLPGKYVDEDRFQSKVGLLVKAGPDAFKADGQWWDNVTINQNDWLVYRPSDGWNVTVNNVSCRMFVDTSIRGRVSHPDLVY
jgi:hypothetical protein